MEMPISWSRAMTKSVRQAMPGLILLAGCTPELGRVDIVVRGWRRHEQSPDNPDDHREIYIEYEASGSAIASASTASGGGSWVPARRPQEMIPAAWWADETAFAAVQVNYAYARSRRLVL